MSLENQSEKVSSNPLINKKIFAQEEGVGSVPNGTPVRIQNTLGGEKVKAMFSEVANSYDKANSVLSLGIHHLWRKKLIKKLGPLKGLKVLDCATGTGDLAIEFKKAVGESGAVVGTDFCEAMLSHAPIKAKKKNLAIRFEVADVMDLHYADQIFDVVSISFGIRNVQSPLRGLREMARVCKKDGGRVVVLEFGQVQVPMLKWLFNFYSQNVLPWLGGLVSGKPQAYQYLQQSSKEFPSGENFKQLMFEAYPFSTVEVYALSGGIAYLYIATK